MHIREIHRLLTCRQPDPTVTSNQRIMETYSPRITSSIWIIVYGYLTTLSVQKTKQRRSYNYQWIIKRKDCGIKRYWPHLRDIMPILYRVGTRGPSEQEAMTADQ
jgi:hypothetical protein